jgi:hypothetical protein
MGGRWVPVDGNPAAMPHAQLGMALALRDMAPYVALTRAGTISPILGFLDRVGVPRDPILATAGLPSWIMADREALIPGASPARLLRAAFRHADVPNLGLTVGERSDIEALGTFGRLIRNAPTLGAALESSAGVRRSLRIGCCGCVHGRTGWSSA